AESQAEITRTQFRKAEEYFACCDPWPLNPEGELLLGVKLESPEGIATPMSGSSTNSAPIGSGRSANMPCSMAPCPTSCRRTDGRALLAFFTRARSAPGHYHPFYTDCSAMRSALPRRCCLSPQPVLYT